MQTVLISYTSKDLQWAEWIAWQVEAAGYRAILQAWDFRPGSNFVLEMQKATIESNRIIAVLTSSYLDSHFTQPEWAAAFARDPRGEKKLLIPVRVAQCEPRGLLPNIVYIDLVGKDEKEAQRALIAGLGHDRLKPANAPPFPAPKFPGEIPSEGPELLRATPRSGSAGADSIVPGAARSVVMAPESFSKAPVFSSQMLRRTALAEIADACSKHPIVAIEGLPGSGKTFAVAAYATRRRKATTKAFAHWFTLRPRETLDELLIRMGSWVELSGTALTKSMAVTGYLRETKSILILDDFHEVDVLSYSPLIESAARLGEPALLILISRVFVDVEPNWSVIGHLSISGFTKAELAAYLQRRRVIIAPQILDRLHRETGGLPLAVSLFSTLVDQFNEDPQYLLSGEMEQNTRLRNWFHSISERLTQDEQTLLGALSVYQSSFDRELVKSVCDHLQIYRASRSFEVLQKRFLIQPDVRYSWTVHNLIALLASSALPEETERSLLLLFAEHSRSQVQFLPGLVLPEHDITCAVRAVHFYQRAKAFDKSERLLIDLSYTAMSRGLYNLFIPLAEWQIRNYAKGDTWIEYYLAHCYQIIGKVNDAFKISERLKATTSTSDPNKSISILRLHSDLLASLGRLEEALEEIHESLSSVERCSVAPHRWLHAKSIEVMVLTNLGRYEQALSSAGELLYESENLSNVRGIAVAHMRLGIVEVARLNSAIAATHFRKAIEDFRKSKDLRGEAWALCHCGELLFDQGRNTEGRKALQTGITLSEHIGECSADYRDLLNRVSGKGTSKKFAKQLQKELGRVYAAPNATHQRSPSTMNAVPPVN